MYGPGRNSYYVFPRVLTFPSTSFWETPGLEGKQN